MKKKIEKDYILGLKYKEIQEKYNITNSQLIYLIQKNNWKRKSNRSKVMKNNKNAKGNKGGGAPSNNKNAVTTGEYETLFSSFFSEEENTIYTYNNFDNTEKELLHEIKLLTIRESRMLSRIQQLQKGSDMTIIALQKTKNDDETTIQTKANNKIAEIQKIEESLTRIQKTKGNYIAKLDKFRKENKKPGANDINETARNIEEYIWMRKNNN